MAASSHDAEVAKQIQLACNTMEMAPDAASRSAADQFLQSFRSSVRPYALCTLLLHTEGASPHVQFVALATMKEALRREGRLLGAAQLHQLKEQLLQLVVARVHVWSRYVLKQCLHVIAILFKWICLDADEVELRSRARPGRPSASPPPEAAAADPPAAYISMANTVGAWLQRGMEAMESESNAQAGAATGAASASSLFSLSLELSQALISEFSPGGQAANAGVSVSMHVRCHARFEEHVLLNLASAVVSNCLPALLRRAMDLAQQPAAAAAATAPPALLMQLQVLHSLLAFLDATLHFDFRDPKRPDSLAMKWALASSTSSATAAAEDAPQPATVMLRPAARWGAILVRAPLVEMLATAHTLLQGLGARWGESGLEHRWPAAGDAAHLLRNCLLQLASLRGEVLHNPTDAAAAATAAAPSPIGGAVSSDPASGASVRGSTLFLERLLGALNSIFQTGLSSSTAQLQAQGSISERAGAELLGVAGVVNRLLCNVNVEELLRLPNAALLPQQVQLQLQLALLLLPLSNGGGPRPRGSGGAPAPRRVQTSTWVQEALDVCLDVWYTVITQMEELGADQAAAAQASSSAAGAQLRKSVPLEPLRQVQQLVHQGSGMVFEAYVRARVVALEAPQHSNGQAGDDDDEEDEEDEEGQFAEEGYIDEHLAKVATLGKVHTTAALQLVSQQIARMSAAWQSIVQAAQGGQGAAPGSPSNLSPYAVYELLYFLLRLLGHLCSPCPSWREMDPDALFASIPSQVLDAVSATGAAGASETGAQAVKAAIDSVMLLSLFVCQLLEHGSGANGSASSSALKECCSPLVLECMVWVLQQLLSAGYFLIDERGAVDRRGLGETVPAHRPFPPVLLHLYGAGGGGAVPKGAHSDQIVEALLRLAGALLTHYNEEPALMEHVGDLLSLCVRHAPLRARFAAQLADPRAPFQPFKALFHDALLGLLTTDPFALMEASSSSSGGGGGGQAVLLRYQASQPLYNLTPTMMQRLAHVLVQSAVFRPEEDVPSSGSGDARAWQRTQSLQLLQGILVSVTRSFYSTLLHPQFRPLQSRALLLKSLSNLVAFWSGMVGELHVDYFEFMWHWLTCTEAASAVPPQAADIEARIKASSQEAQVRVRQSKLASQRGAASTNNSVAASNGSSNGDAGGGRNILQSMVDLVRSYGSDDGSASTASSGPDGGSSLELLQGVLSFFTSLCASYLSYLDVAQSYLLMQSTLQLVTAFTGLMERRTSATALALRAAQQQQQAGNGAQSQRLLAKQQLKAAALASDLSLLEESEWSSLRALLQLLEGLSSKDLVDLSAESVEFASDAVMRGLVLLVPRLAGGQMLAQPDVALLFFSLLSGLVASNPDKLASALDENQRGHMMRMIQMVLQPPNTTTTTTTTGAAVAADGSPSPEGASGSSASSSLFGRTTAQLHSALLKEACLAVQALAQYHLYFVSGRAEADRAAHAKEDAAAAAAGGGEAAKRAQLLLQSRPALPPPSPYGPACAMFLESLLHLLLFSHVSSELLEAVSDALLPTILCQEAAFVQLVQGALAGWKATQMAKLQAAAAAGAADPAAQQAQLAQTESMYAELESSFRALVPTGAANKSGSHGGGGAMMSAVGGRFSSLSTRTMKVERSQRMLFRQQVRTFVLTARPLLQMR